MNDRHKPSHQMTVHGKVGDHPRGNFWFADRLAEDEPGYEPGWPWCVFIQLAGVVNRLDSHFRSRAEAETFIRDDILGAGAQLGDT